MEYQYVEFFETLLDRNPRVYCKNSKYSKPVVDVLCSSCAETQLNSIKPSKLFCKNKETDFKKIPTSILKSLDEDYGFVYIIKHNDFVKVGMSKNIKSRLNSQNHIYSKLQLLGLFYCKHPLYLEGYLLEKFRNVFQRNLRPRRCDYFYLSAYHLRRFYKYLVEFFTYSICKNYNVCEIMPEYYEYLNVQTGQNGFEIKNCSKIDKQEI